MQCFKTQHEWHPQKIVFDDRADQEYAVLVLNRPIDLPMTTERMLNLWEHGKFEIMFQKRVSNCQKCLCIEFNELKITYQVFK